MEWNPGTLAGVLANERHCGDVLARKTFTPNFLTLSTATALTILSGGLLILSNALANLGGMTLGQIGVALAAMAGGLIEMGVALTLVKGSLGSATSFLIMSVVLNALVSPLKSLGEMSLEEIGHGLLAVGGALGIFAIAVGTMSLAGPIVIAVSAALSLLAGSFALLLGTMAAVSLMPLRVEALVVALGTLGSAIGVFIAGVIAGLGTAAGSIAIAIAEIIVAVCNAIAQAVPAIGNALAQLIVAICNVIVQCSEPIGQALFTLGTVVIQTIIDLIAWAWDGGGEGGGIKGALSELLGNIVAWLSEHLNPINLFGGLLGTISGFFGKIGEYMSQGLANGLNTGASVQIANNGVQTLCNKVKDFFRNKSKKNNNDRTQYRQKNHHEAIVSREVFNAANHLRASRNYSKKNRPLPVLSVVEDGILRGYVPFDKDWTGFSAEEYREASESVMKEPDVTVTADVKKRLDLTGYEIVRVQYFSTMQNPAMTISNGRLRFNTACLKKFENVEYVELLLNSVERCIAIRPCDKNNPNAIRWGRLKEGRWCASTLGCRGLAKTLFDIMEWDEDLRYRFRGQFLEQGDNKMMLFAFDEPEMIKVEEIVLPPKENTEEDEGETVKKKIYIFPPEWAGTFGQPITSIAQVGILRQEHYAGNWDVFRPATEIEEMNIFTAESLNELLREAEKIMEGWTDYR